MRSSPKPVHAIAVIALGALLGGPSMAFAQSSNQSSNQTSPATKDQRVLAAKGKRSVGGRANRPLAARSSQPLAAKAEGTAPQRSGATAEPVAVPQPLAEEARHVALYDAAIAPLRNYALAGAEAEHVKRAIAAGTTGRLSEAKSERNALTDPAGQKLVDWYTYRAGYGTPQEIRAFLDGNPDWPDRALLTQRAEEALFRANAGSREIKGFFAANPPRSAAGLAALASAHLADKEQEEAKALAAQAWTWSEGELPAGLEPLFLARLGSLLTPADHKRRLDRLLANDSRWVGERNQRAAVIRRLIPLLPEAERRAGEARLAVYLRAKNSHELMAKLPAHSGADWGLAVQKAQALRRQNRSAEAANVLLAESSSDAEVKPDGWWEERRVNAYAALKNGKPEVAYALAAKPGALSINATKDAAFLAGWLALRELNDPKRALAHFQELAKAADGPLSRARGEYWLGRTYEALADPASAELHYRAASRYVDTFHGQLALLRLDPSVNTLKITPPAEPTADEIARFTGSEAVRAAAIAHKASLDISIRRVFLNQLRLHMQSEAEVAMLAHLAQALGDTQAAVHIGKAAIARGMNLLYYAYPVQALPQYTPLRRPPEAAFILGIARQESEFDMTTLSGAGARGLLQVMPVTARHVCSDYKIKCDIPRLMKDPAYNTMMGSAYIADRMQEFGGSYVLTLAGYNAGPGRAREWIKEFGDPRDGNVDAIDWIHRIPIEETREYVQKVLSNIQVYRARLGDEAHALRLTADLKRHASSAAADAPPASP